MKAILFDLEGTLYDSQTKNFCNAILPIYQYAKRKQRKVAIATGANYEEIKKIEKDIPLKKLFGKNIFSSKEQGYESKACPDFFRSITQQLNVEAKKTLLIDDGENGIKGASLCDIQNFFLKKNKEQQLKDLLQKRQKNEKNSNNNNGF